MNASQKIKLTQDERRIFLAIFATWMMHNYTDDNRDVDICKTIFRSRGGIALSMIANYLELNNYGIVYTSINPGNFEEFRLTGEYIYLIISSDPTCEYVKFGTTNTKDDFFESEDHQISWADFSMDPDFYINSIKDILWNRSISKK